MTSTMKTLSLAVMIAVVAPACATKGFVREEIEPVNERVDTLATSLEETQERTRQNEEAIGEVGQRAGAAADAAQTAQNSAEAAAMAADRVNSRVDEVEETTDSLRRLIFEVTINEEAGNFTFGSAELPEAARTRLDQLVSDLQQNPASVWVEIEGHTDATGPAALNQRLGMERAEAVKMYLYEQHRVPLHKMNVISYGEDRPVAPNETADGRAQNRRVVIRVLS